jgi:hypothetical protein
VKQDLYMVLGPVVELVKFRFCDVCVSGSIVT